MLDETAYSGGEIAYRFLLESHSRKTAIRAYAGYAGWAARQLQAEIERGDWRVVPGDQQLIFDAKPGEIWDKLSKIPTERWI